MSINLQIWYFAKTKESPSLNPPELSKPPQSLPSTTALITTNHLIHLYKMATTISSFRPIRSPPAPLPLIRSLSLVSPFLCLDTKSSSSSLSFQRNGLWARAQDKSPTGSFISFAKKQSEPNSPTNQFQVTHLFLPLDIDFSFLLMREIYAVAVEVM